MLTFTVAPAKLSLLDVLHGESKKYTAKFLS